MPWFLLLLAGLLEVAWAVCLKLSEGLTKPLPSVGALAFMIASVWLLALSLRDLPVGVAYAAWTGIGAVGAVTVGMVALGEPRDLPRILCLLLVAVGVLGLKVFSPASEPAKLPVRSSSEGISEGNP